MLTPREQSRMGRIQTAAESGQYVSDDEKQWVLAIIRRENFAVPADAIDAVSKAGYSIDGLIVESSD